MQINNNNSSEGWFLPALTLLFIALKLTGHITWSWFWVLSPLIFGVCLSVILGFIALYIFNRN